MRYECTVLSNAAAGGPAEGQAGGNPPPPPGSAVPGGSPRTESRRGSGAVHAVELAAQLPARQAERTEAAAPCATGVPAVTGCGSEPEEEAQAQYGSGTPAEEAWAPQKPELYPFLRNWANPQFLSIYINSRRGMVLHNVKLSNSWCALLILEILSFQFLSSSIPQFQLLNLGMF